MGMPDTIQPGHLSRLAIVYVRQSSPHQALANKESLRLQYDLRGRAVAAGWPASQVRVIDTDLGHTGRSAEGRTGFQELVALVNEGRVGIIFAYDVTRLARNCTDWYALLDLCGWRHCLVGDQEGICDPATPNGRLILGLKGLISELELHTLRARLTAGLLSKAQRGELAQMLPAGLVRDDLGRVVKHPSQEVQTRLDLVFATFLRVGIARHVVRVFQEQGLLLPRLDDSGDLVWRDATASSVLRILKNPAYAGCFAYGRARTVPRAGAPQKKAREALPVPEWKIRIPDKYPAYISWATFETIQGMLRDNRAEYEDRLTRGVPRAGKALLHGLLYCGACGHKLVVRYKKEGARYLCNALRERCQVPTCQSVAAAPLDACVLQAFFDALSPAQLDLYDRAAASLRQDDEQLRRARAQQLERLRYQARLAERQYNQADPDNRLVAAELEKRWEVVLRELKEAEEQCQHQPPGLPEGLSPEEQEALRQAGQRIPELWRQGLLSPPQQKALLRCLIDKVVVRRATDTIQVRIVWKGGDTTEAALPARLRSLAELPGVGEMEKQALKLSKEGRSDPEIATLLTQRGFRSPRRDVLRTSTVRNIRLRHRQLSLRGTSCPRRIPGYLTVPQVADRLNVPLYWVYDRIHNGTIEVARDAVTRLYLFPDKARTIAQFKQLQAGKVQKLRF
jgi:DNA invertase Pin-like site-specific DNA recombinase